VHRDADADPLTEPAFEDAEHLLLCLLADEVDDGHDLTPTMLVFAGQRPLGLVALRPHAPDDLVTALIEILALLLPLGTDRIVLALPGRAWSTDDPIAPVSDDVDLRQRVVVAVVADAHRGPCRLRVGLHPFDVDEQGRWSWQPEVETAGPLDAPVVDALRLLLDHRDDLAGTATGAQITTQFGRVLLLGHEVALAPAGAQALRTATGTDADPDELLPYPR
jgi:hypothetical protein